MRRGWKILIALVVIIAELLAVNTVVVDGETKPAEVNVDGGKIMKLNSVDLQVVDRPATGALHAADRGAHHDRGECGVLRPALLGAAPAGVAEDVEAGHQRDVGAAGADLGGDRCGEFLDEVEQLELRYVVEVPVNTTVWTEDPASCVPPYRGRGRVPTLPSRESVASVAAVASGPETEG